MVAFNTLGMKLVNPGAKPWLEGLPDRFREAVVGGLAVAVRAIDDLKAVAIVGSLAEGSWAPIRRHITYFFPFFRLRPGFFGLRSRARRSPSLSRKLGPPSGRPVRW